MPGWMHTTAGNGPSPGGLRSTPRPRKPSVATGANGTSGQASFETIGRVTRSCEYRRRGEAAKPAEARAKNSRRLNALTGASIQGRSCRRDEFGDSARKLFGPGNPQVVAILRFKALTVLATGVELFGSGDSGGHRWWFLHKPKRAPLTVPLLPGRCTRPLMFLVGMTGFEPATP